ncbi:STE18 [Candida pseudojiufengensis]|uniref:STE18 n=1 Tax=Candida pseudojiufengensis TaxID=497109 RepID=UPI002224C34D|nr:STE18 [Candida pseudojiufengensis]KAI5959809.1 STE18 [Candida pseudojiufengensis]
MSEIENQIQVIKLKRIKELNNRLTQTLKRERIPVSKSSALIIKYVEETPDYLIPYNWKLPNDQNKFLNYQNYKALHGNTNKRAGSGGGCCTIM